MTTSTTVAGFGISASLPSGWEGRITMLAPAAPMAAGSAVASVAQAQAATSGAPVGVAGPAAKTEITKPFLHLANFPLPPKRGAFGTGAVEMMSGTDVLVVVFEYSAESVGTALFAPAGMPRVLYPRVFVRPVSWR